MNLEFSRRILEKKSYVKFYEHSSTGSRIVLWGQTDRQTDPQTDGQTEIR